MDKSNELNEIVEVVEREIDETFKKTTDVKMKDCPKRQLDYTNRRRIQKLPVDKSLEEREKENEEEFENIRLQLKDLTVSDNSSNKKSVFKAILSEETSNVNYNRHPEVEEFQEFLDSEGGHYGGWKEKDHLFFLKIRKKYPLKKTADIVHENFPDISVEKILAHQYWYDEYMKLKTAKKRAIEEWKKTQKVSMKVEEEPNKETKPQSDPKPQIKRDPNLKEKIEIWKAHCVAAKLEREEQKRKEDIKRRKEEEERKKIQEEKRALVNRYREEKISLELAIKTAKETEELEAKRVAAVKAASLLKYFRYEDRRFTERQKAKKQTQVKPEPRIKSAVDVKRDPNRLLQPTLGWIYHTQRNSDSVSESHTSLSLDLSHLPKLKKPAWRRGITSP